MDNERIINIFLLFGLVLGIGLASISLVKETNFELEEEWIAKIENTKISKARFNLQIQAFASDKRSPLSQEDRDFVLERMIEEELLIQRAKDLGLLSTNTMVRGTIVQQMINSIISGNNILDIKENDLRNFYNNNKSFFTSADRLRVRQLYFSDSDKNNASEKAEEVFLYLLEGGDFTSASKMSDSSAMKLPDTLITLGKLREYLGPSLTKVAQNMKPGEFTDPKRVINGYKILFLIDRVDAPIPEFSSIKDQVRSEFMKRRDDLALRNYLDDLKNWYEVTRNSE